MKNFQRRQTTLWRGTDPKTLLMIPPVIIEDETKNKGTEKLILLMLAMFGILELTSQEGTNGDVKGLKLSDDY